MSSTVRTRRYAAAAAALCAAVWAHAPALAADAKEIASTVCIACHGEGGNSTVPTFPRLAGMQAEYIAKQLNDYISGKRKSDMMGPIVATLKSDDVSALAAYFAAQKPQPGAVQDAKLAAAGKQLFDDGNVETGVPACVGCHQPGGTGNERYPRLAGQHQTYMIAQMTAFKSGERSNDKARVMRSVAERLTEKEIAAAAEYLAGL